MHDPPDNLDRVSIFAWIGLIYKEEAIAPYRLMLFPITGLTFARSPKQVYLFPSTGFGDIPGTEDM
jgi:hypothetical protein